MFILSLEIVVFNSRGIYQVYRELSTISHLIIVLKIVFNTDNKTANLKSLNVNGFILITTAETLSDDELLH